ncbi:MAG: phosphatidylglycerophosphatase A [Epsilonproteobacteria bacterium]|nr:phosphatidylglycerophosphatase A [Campylobacterota bacterium]
MNLQKLFLTFFGSGLSPIAPGTVGTFAALIVGVVILYFLGYETLFSLIFATTIIGVLEIDKYEKKFNIHDDKQIVIDEAVGIWLTLVITNSLSKLLPNSYSILIVSILSFISFRLFDILKPSTIGWIDRNIKGGLGVMFDDIFAAIAAGALNLLLIYGIFKLFS